MKEANGERRELSDDDLRILRLMRDDPSAGLDLLAARYQARAKEALVRAFGRHHLELIDDAVQQALCNILQRARTLEIESSVGGYLVSTARSALLRDLEWYHLLVFSGTSSSTVGQEARAASEKTRGELRERIVAAIDGLPQLERAVLQADYRRGHPVPARELAEEFDCSAAAVYQARSRGLRHLREALGDLRVAAPPSALVDYGDDSPGLGSK